MTTIYLVRHGATTLNDQTDTSVDRIRGWADLPLVEEGRVEARNAALKLKPKGIGVIITSDLSRAHETGDIIGKILGVKAVTSHGLRPWNLGALTGVTTKEALPQIAEYAQEKPDTPVPEGESFDTFKARAFAGLADAIEQAGGKTLLIVTHHRNERLYEAWDKAGQPEDHAIDLGEFLKKGDPPGGIKVMQIKGTPSIGPVELNAGYRKQMADAAVDRENKRKVSKAEAGYTLAPKGSEDRCGTCKAFLAPNACSKVDGQIATAGWCKLGHSKADGHAFSSEGSEEASEAPAETQPGNYSSNTLAHGRAIAGAKALHAVGHITAAQRDKHMKASQAAIRKPFGSWDAA